MKQLSDIDNAQVMIIMFSEKTIKVKSVNWVWADDWSHCMDQQLIFDLVIACGQWPLLLTWFNFNPSMDK